MRRALSALLAITVLAGATAAQADILQYTARPTGASEVPPNSATGDGIAAHFYDDRGTGDLADDVYDFTLSVSGLTAAPSAFHIHGAAAAGENGPVRVGLDSDPAFVRWVGDMSLLVGGNDVPAPMIPATPSTPTNPGYPGMSFLDMLNQGLAYVNVHTVNFPAGELRGQFIAVQAIPEPGTYALLLAGLGAVGQCARRRKGRPHA